MKQNILFSISDNLDIKPFKNFYLLFDNLKSVQLAHFSKTGRKPFHKEALLNALIFKNLKSILTLTELKRELIDNPNAALCCDFNIRKPILTLERFSKFL